MISVSDKSETRKRDESNIARRDFINYFIYLGTTLEHERYAIYALIIAVIYVKYKCTNAWLRNESWKRNIKSFHLNIYIIQILRPFRRYCILKSTTKYYFFLILSKPLLLSKQSREKIVILFRKKEQKFELQIDSRINSDLPSTLEILLRVRLTVLT